MEQLMSAVPPPHGSFGAVLRARRHRALLSQQQLVARAELSERTVRDLEANRVRSPRTNTVRLLADALQLTGPERESWSEAAIGVNHQRAGPAAPGEGSAAQEPDDAPAQPPHRACGSEMGSKPRRRRSLSVEFTAEIVELCHSGDRPIGQMAKDASPPLAVAGLITFELTELHSSAPSRCRSRARHAPVSPQQGQGFQMSADQSLAPTGSIRVKAGGEQHEGFS
jgi:transcriptional regulator with XRE-family HTH domain